MNPFSFESSGHDLQRFWLRWDTQANYHHLGELLQLYLGDYNIAHLLLWPTNSSLLVQPGQSDSGGTEHLVMPTKQITSE